MTVRGYYIHAGKFLRPWLVISIIVTMLIINMRRAYLMTDVSSTNHIYEHLSAVLFFKIHYGKLEESYGRVWPS